MNLEPRKAPPGDWWKSFRLCGCDVDTPPPKAAPASIWRMELPNTSYMAPQAAFWWVSNDKR